VRLARQESLLRAVEVWVVGTPSVAFREQPGRRIFQQTERHGGRSLRSSVVRCKTMQGYSGSLFRSQLRFGGQLGGRTKNQLVARQQVARDPQQAVARLAGGYDDDRFGSLA